MSNGTIIDTTEFGIPINGITPCGEDPRYLDDFLFIKEELDKLSNTDYEQVYTLSGQLLVESCKDLRVAAYHLLSSVYLNGTEGLRQGLHGFRLVVCNFWKECHPVRENARLAALGLLNTPRLIAFAEQHNSELDAAILAALKQETEQINTFLVKTLGDEAPRLSGLASWLTKQEKFLPAEPSSPEPVGQPQQTPDSDTKTEPQAAVNTPPISLQPLANIGSTRELENETRKLHSYLCNSNELYQAMSLSRTMLWGGSTFPPHTNYQTRVPAPRQSAWAELAQLAADKNPQLVFQLSEKVFFEPGFRYNLALQQLVWQHAQQHGFKDLAILVETTSCNYISRFPDLTELCYADGSPFCSAEASLWLEDIKRSQAPTNGTSAKQESSDNTETDAVISSALHAAREKRLPEALTILRDGPRLSAMDRVRLQLTEAQVCQSAGKNQLAGIVLEELYQHVIHHKLETWQPDLLMEIVELRSKVVMTLLKSAKNETKDLLMATLEELKRVACRVDLVAASQFIK